MPKLPDPTSPVGVTAPRPASTRPPGPSGKIIIKEHDVKPTQSPSGPSGEIRPGEIKPRLTGAKPRLTDAKPTKPPPSPPKPPPPPSSQVASISEIRPSPFRFVKPLLLIIILAGLGFVVTRFIFLRKKPLEIATLTYWGLWEPEQVIHPAIAKFESTHPQIKITYQMQSKQEYRERLQSALARKEGPDIMRIHSSWLPMFQDQLSPATTEQFSAEEFGQAFYPVAGESLVKNGQVVAVPLMVDGLGLFVNNEIFNSASADVPDNWDDLRKTAFALTTRDQHGQIIRSGVALGTTNNVTHWPDIFSVLMLQNSVDLARPAAAVDAQGRNLGGDALRYYTIFTLEDRIWDETLPQDITAFVQGKVAMILAPSWQAHEILHQNPNLDFSIHPIPQLSSHHRITWASYWVEAVSRHSQHPQEAWEFLKYLTSREALQLSYTEAAKIRAFGEPYPRRDMAETLKQAKYVGAYITQAPDGQSWYVNSRTHDNGLNDEIASYYADAINAVLQGKAEPEEALSTAGKGVEQVLTKYGVK